MRLQWRHVANSISYRIVSYEILLTKYFLVAWKSCRIFMEIFGEGDLKLWSDTASAQPITGSQNLDPVLDNIKRRPTKEL